MGFRASKPKIAIKEHLPDFKEHLPDIDLPGSRHKRHGGRLVMAGLPVLGLLALGMLKNRRKTTHRTTVDGWQRQSLDPALGTPADQTQASVEPPLAKEGPL